jgi:acyl-CoA reductase-like NAD-dependent aldehyde dehydrogenase
MTRSARKSGGRVEVKKTWKLFVGGAFVRTESGRYVVSADGADNIPHASRKDARDAVQAAATALPGWSARSAMNRGQILYRLAEIMEARQSELVAVLARGGARRPDRETSCAIDRAVSFAGWADKFQSILGSHNPVAGPHFGFSVVEPMGVVALAAPARPSLLGLVATVCAIVVSGNVVVAIASQADPRSALSLAECWATSDLPAGVVNVLSGSASELLPTLAKHKGVRALDLWGVAGEKATELERLAAENVKRVTRRSLDDAAWYDDRAGVSPSQIEPFVETKSVWHPVGV